MENKKIYTGYASFRFNDAHTHAIGTNKEEVEKFLVDSMQVIADEVSDCCEADHIFTLELPCINEYGSCFDLGNDQSYWVDEVTNQDHIRECLDDDEVIKLGNIDRERVVTYTVNDNFQIVHIS
jgi:hypothetical protein|tara:strand:- start:1090 stop:1461 length:372 start_codon:yes stop_codon:yes gene_type:complete